MTLIELENLLKFLQSLEENLVCHGVDLHGDGIVVCVGEQPVKVDQVRERNDPSDWHFEVTVL